MQRLYKWIPIPTQPKTGATVIMIKAVALVALFCAISSAEDDKKWVWKGNSREGKTEEGRDASARYEVYEGERPLRPNFQNDAGLSYNERPYGNRPNFRPDFIPNERPGGVYGNVPTAGGHYGPNYNHHLHNQGPDYHQPEVSGPGGILTGPVPSWVKEGPFKNYDKCKCTEKFNCNSPGISYGHCDTGKQYCCYASKKIDQIGGPLPSRPSYSIENGILVGPGGPVDGHHPPIRPGTSYPINNRRPIGGPIGGGGNNFPIRPGGLGGGYPRPGFGGGNSGFGLGGPGGAGGYLNRPIDPYRGPSAGSGGGNIHSIENGILVGPGGPYDVPYRNGNSNVRPGFNGGYSRSAKN